MILHWADLALAFTMIVIVCAATYVVSTRKLRRVLLERELRIADQLAALDDAIRALETRMAEHASALRAAQEGGAETAADAGHTTPREEQVIKPGIRAAIAAAATAFLGKNAVVRSAKAIEARDGASPWSQQGRVLVQTSHNLPSRR